MANKGLLNSGEDRRAEREDNGCGECDESLLAEEEENAINGRRRIARERTRGMAADALENVEENEAQAGSVLIKESMKG